MNIVVYNISVCHVPIFSKTVLWLVVFAWLLLCFLLSLHHLGAEHQSRAADKPKWPSGSRQRDVIGFSSANLWQLTENNWIFNDRFVQSVLRSICKNNLRPIVFNRPIRNVCAAFFPSGRFESHISFVSNGVCVQIEAARSLCARARGHSATLT